MNFSYSSASIARRGGRVLNNPKQNLGRFASKSHHRQRQTSFFEWYSNCLETHPILTKSVTSAMIAGAGDCLCQANENHSPWDAYRTARFSTLGFFMVGPGCHYWYAGLAKWFPGTSVSQVAWRVIVDQLAFNPPFLIVWLTAFWKMEGIQFESFQEYTDKMREHFPSIIVANWALWFPVQAFTFRFVPIQFQVLATNCFDLLWNAYLSFSTSSMADEELNVDTEEEKDAHTAADASTLSVKDIRNETLL